MNEFSLSAAKAILVPVNTDLNIVTSSQLFPMLLSTRNSLIQGRVGEPLVVPLRFLLNLRRKAQKNRSS